MALIVAVHSFRGGTGKSNLTANLAIILASQGGRLAVVDTDLQSPGIHLLFNLEEERTGKVLNDYLWRRCPIEETVHDVTPPMVAERGGAVLLIPSSVKTAEIARVLREGYDVGLLSDGFHALISKLRLDYLLLDTHPGVNEETLLSIAVSDVSVLILRPDQQDYQGTAVTLEITRKLGVPRVLLVVNKAAAWLDLNALRQQVEQTYAAPVAAVFTHNDEMLELQSGGIFCLRYPEHPFTEELRKLAARVAGQPAPVKD